MVLAALLTLHEVPGQGLLNKHSWCKARACILVTQSSGLVRHVFRLLEQALKDNRGVAWVLLENVSRYPFALMMLAECHPRFFLFCLLYVSTYAAMRQHTCRFCVSVPAVVRLHMTCWRVLVLLCMHVHATVRVFLYVLHKTTTTALSVYSCMLSVHWRLLSCTLCQPLLS